ncbi:MFS general substrate transporter [Apiospora kogelbergensis]|uniref:MFS general substrate transporter n=1 Tax=Apiospora kogelbergensis TaxID=1337665 RepID=A0AAW0QN65_9PEZI
MAPESQDNRITSLSRNNGPTSRVTKVNSGSEHEATVEEKELQSSQAPSNISSPPDDSPYILVERDHPHCSAYVFSTSKKWRILIVVFLVQCSMNFNTSLYANGQKGMAEEFGITEQTARAGAGAFLVLYGFGCELWAPWSEELGRWPVLQISLGLVNFCCIFVGIARNFATVLAFRCLGGLFSAGGSVTLGIVADMYHADDQQYAVLFVVLSSVGGSIFGPIVGGFVEYYLHWRWTIWLQLIAGVAVQALHFFLVDETRVTCRLGAHAKRLRKSRDLNCWGPNEQKTWKEILAPAEMTTLWLRPFKMFVTEPIVAVLSLLSGFSDALIFMGFQSFGLVYEVWGFNSWQIGLTFVAIGLGYLVAYLSFFPAIKRQQKMEIQHPESDYAKFEARLWWLMYTAPCLPIGLAIFAWTSTSSSHWMGPIAGSAVIGIANFAIYQATIDYMVAAYGPYSASATGGNGFARDVLAGILTWAAMPFYDHFRNAYPKNGLQFANTALAGISCVLVVSAMAIYWNGAALRKRSSFAQKLAAEEEDAIPNATHMNYTL